MVDGPAAALGKRKADEVNLDEPTQPARHIKRIRPAASNRDRNAAEQAADGVLATIERDTHTGASTEMELDSDADDEREISWSLSPDRELPVPEEAGRTETNQEPPGGPSGNELAPSPFVPFPARAATPVNTLHNYHGGVAPERGPKQPQRKSTKSRARPSAPRRTVHNYYDGSHDQMVLIADLEELRKIARLGVGAKEVTFRAKAQFERHFGRPPTKADMDETCTMTSFEPGVLRSKPRTWKTIDVGKKDDWKDEYDERDLKFRGLMSKVGQSEKSFRERIATGLLSEETGKFQTPVGERRRHQAYFEALKAGQYNPDALIHLEDGGYKAIYLKLYKGTRGLTSFKDVTEKYGKDNVWLRTVDFDYMTHEQFDRHGTTVDAAEKMFCDYTGRTYQPNVFVRVSDGKWLSKERYDEQNRNNFDEDLAEIEILALGKNNQGFLQPKTLKWMEPDLYQQRMREAHLTGYVPSQPVSSRGALKLEPICDILSAKPNRSSAPILMQTSRDEIVSIATIPPGVERYRIFPQNVSEKTGEYTGNYTRNWRSIRREEKFRVAAADRDDLYLQPVDAPEKPKRRVTDEQRRILRTPSPSPAQSDVSDGESSARRSSASLPPDSSDDEALSPPAARRLQLSLPPDNSDDDLFVRQNTASIHSDSRSTRLRLSLPPDSSDDDLFVRQDSASIHSNSSDSDRPVPSSSKRPPLSIPPGSSDDYEGTSGRNLSAATAAPANNAAAKRQDSMQATGSEDERPPNDGDHRTAFPAAAPTSPSDENPLRFHPVASRIPPARRPGPPPPGGFDWSSDSSDDDLPVSIPRAASQTRNSAEKNVDRASTAGRSPSSDVLLEDRHCRDRSRDNGRD